MLIKQKNKLMKKILIGSAVLLMTLTFSTTTVNAQTKENKKTIKNAPKAEKDGTVTTKNKVSLKAESKNEGLKKAKRTKEKTNPSPKQVAKAKNVERAPKVEAKKKKKAAKAVTTEREKEVMKTGQK